MDQIAALRAAAAKLDEAVALTPSPCTRAKYLLDDAMYCILHKDTGDAAGAISALADFHLMGDNAKVWCYLVEAARLRLLVEALLLEQDAARLHPNDHDFAWQEKRHDAELGALVREWWGGVNRG